MATIELIDRAKTGNFKYIDGDYNFHGAYNASELDNALNTCNGSIEGEHGTLGTFTLERNLIGEKRLSLNVPFEVSDTILPIAKACVTAIEAELVK